MQTHPTLIEAARRARAKHSILTPEEIAHSIACSYGIALDRLPQTEADIVAALVEADRAAPLHHARAASGNVPGLYEPRCTCGWRGPLSDETTADADAAIHVSVAHTGDAPLAGPGSETADEYNRRIS
jgi:hypothetical protein